MYDGDQDFTYLCVQLKKGIVIGAGITLFSSGIIIGIKAASVIVNTVTMMSSDGITLFKQTVTKLIEDDDNDSKER